MASDTSHDPSTTEITKLVVNPRRGRISDLAQMDKARRQKMLGYIRAGAFDCQAAKAVGLTATQFMTWKRRGQEDDFQGVESEYRDFYRELSQASSQARITAEIEIKRENTLAWLRTIHRSRPVQLEDGTTATEEGWDLDPQKVLHQHEGTINQQVDMEIHIAKEKNAAIVGAFQVFQDLALDPQKVLEYIPASEDGLSEEDLTEAVDPRASQPPAQESSSGQGSNGVQHPRA